MYVEHAEPAGGESAELPLVAVVYDLGAGPGEIMAAARSVCDLLFICDSSDEHVAQIAPSLAQRSRVCDITGLNLGQAAAAVAAAHPSGITTFSERKMEVTTDLAAACGLSFHSVDTTRLLTDKLAQRTALAAAGIDTTRYRAVTGPDDAVAAIAEVGLPAVVKPRRGYASRGVRRVDSVAECRAAIAEQVAGSADDALLLVEEYLRGEPSCAGSRWGDYVSVEAIVHDGEVEPVCITGKCRLAPPFREQGVFLPATVPAELAERIVAVTVGALRALGVRSGLTHTELKLTPNGPKILEVHGRLGGFVADLLRRAGGIDLVRAGLRLALGRRPELPAVAFTSVAFQYFLVPPMDAVAVHGLDGVPELRGLDGVEAVDLRVVPGQRLDWRDGTENHLGTVHGSVPDHARLAELTELVERVFRPTYARSDRHLTDSVLS